MSGRSRRLNRQNKIEKLVEIQVLWRGVAFAATQRRGRWQLAAEGKVWEGPEVVEYEPWSATEERIRTWVDQNVVV